MNDAPLILYLVKEGRETRLGEGAPREFLYGYPELLSAGCNVQLLLDAEVGFERHMNKAKGLINTVIYQLCGIPGWGLIQLWRHRHRFKAADLVFVGTNTFGLALGVLRRLGLLRARVMFIAMGLIEPSTPGRWRRAYRWALRDVHVLSLAQRDAEVLGGSLGRQVDYLPFGVDSDFWQVAPRVSGDYVLSIGNDRHRDYDTLLRAWRPEFPLLRIVTRLPVSTSAANVEVIYGDWHRQSLSDAEVRTLMQQASFVVLPIRKTVQPSGQSAALQAMACGKTVLLTDFPGLWNRDLMRDGVTCVFAGVPGDVEALAAAVASLCSDSERRAAVGAAARKVVESEFNAQRMAEHLHTHMETAIGRSLVSGG
jgi:glycosyltransferase involved in cell wall biosynthesis